MSNEPVVLAIDDEVALLRLIRLELSSQGMRVLTAESGAAGIKMEEEHRPDLVLLDLSMPDLDGFEVMRQLRDRTNIPIIMLTARGSDADKVRGLELGADDYLAKPFGPSELTARVRAVLRRATSPGADAILTRGPLSIDLHRRTVTRDGQPVNLTRTEWLLLQHLAANPGRLMLNSELLTKVWGPEYRGDTQYLRVWISRLRKKVEESSASPKLITTFQGLGYKFSAGDEAGSAMEGVAEAVA